MSVTVINVGAAAAAPSGGHWRQEVIEGDSGEMAVQATRVIGASSRTTAYCSWGQT